VTIPWHLTAADLPGWAITWTRLPRPLGCGFVWSSLPLGPHVRVTHEVATWAGGRRAIA
jgi:hypothetical protein